MQPLPQDDRTVQRRNTTRKSEPFSGSPYKNVVEGKRKSTEEYFQVQKGDFLKPSTS
jgi:hypothetical protein